MDVVYVVCEVVEYEGDNLVKVFANEAAAKAFAAKMNEDNFEGSGYEFVVMEEEVVQ